MNWIERLIGGTRAQLLGLLRRSRVSINDLAAAVGISDNAVRAHVSAMQRDGMVEEVGIERDTGGKPSRLYGITREAEELYPKAYAYVLGGILEVLSERSGREELIGVLREVGRRAAAGSVDGGVGGADERRVNEAAEVLRRLGGELDVETLDGSGWLIRGYGCPLSGVVARHDEACALVESLVGAISGGTVRECCDRSGRPRCAFRIELDENGGDGCPIAKFDEASATQGDRAEGGPPH